MCMPAASTTMKRARYLDDGGLCFGLVEAAVLFLEVERYRPSFHVGVLLS